MRDVCADTQQALIEQIETVRNSRVLVFAASHLEREILPTLYDVLKDMGRCERLDVVAYIKGERLILRAEWHCYYVNSQTIWPSSFLIIANRPVHYLIFHAMK